MYIYRCPRCTVSSSRCRLRDAAHAAVYLGPRSAGTRLSASLASARAGSTRRLRAGDQLAAVLAEVQPVALAWDLAHANRADWSLITKLRAHPQLCLLPFIFYYQEPDAAASAASITNVLVKPLSGKTLLEAIVALRRPAVAGPIVIVDDDPEARALYQQLVVRELPEYPVRLVDGGAAALTLLEREIPSLVILDLMMPNVDGFAVLAQMRASAATRQVPVLIVSGRMLTLADIGRLNQAHVTFHSKDILTQEETAAYLRQALDGAMALPQQTSVLVKQAIVYIQQHHSQPISRQAIATALGVSKNYLTQIFRQELGLSPGDYLNRYRIKRARDLLRSSAGSIADVATQVGFDDSAYFSRVFRKEVGMAPREYRAGRG